MRLSYYPDGKRCTCSYLFIMLLSHTCYINQRQYLITSSASCIWIISIYNSPTITMSAQEKTRWGICGAGKIAHDFTSVLVHLSSKHSVVCTNVEGLHNSMHNIAISPSVYLFFRSLAGSSIHSLNHLFIVPAIHDKGLNYLCFII